MARRKTTIPKTLPLRSSGWTRFRWLASGAGFKSFAWMLTLAILAGGVWSQWGIIQPAVSASVRQVAIAILGEDVVDAPQPVTTAEAQESILEPATAKQRKALTEAIDGVATQITATGATLPATSYTVLQALVGDCEDLILDPSIQSVSVLFCTQQITTETAALKKATADEIARVEAEKKAAEEEAARKAAEEEAARQNPGNNNGNENNGGDDNNWNPPPSNTRMMIVSCPSASSVTVNGITKSVSAGGSASWEVTSGTGFTADRPGCTASIG